MNHVLIVHVFGGFTELMHVVGSFWFSEFLPAFDHFVETLIMAQFEKDVAIRSVFKEVLVLADVSMLECSMNLNFGLKL